MSILTKFHLVMQAQTPGKQNHPLRTSPITYLYILILFPEFHARHSGVPPEIVLVLVQWSIPPIY